MKDRRWIFSILCVMAISAMFVGVPLAKQPASEQPGEDEEFDETAPDTPLPPGFKERVFIHLPRAHKPGHLGTCTKTEDDVVNTYGLAGWRLPNAGITWRLNPATVPKSVGAPAAVEALKVAFATWTAVKNSGEEFNYGGTTSVTRSRLDFVNAVLWGKVSAGAIAVTYIRYYTATGIVADVDTVFNSRYPWAVFQAGVECQSFPDAYDVENIAVHEFGHWVGLDDLYSAADKDLTMYGYGAGGELKKRTLGAGDITGAQAVAP